MEINKIYNEDCLEGMKRIADNSIDLVVTSPPYDNLREYNGCKWDFHNTAKELFRVIKDGGVIVWVVGDAVLNGSETGTSFRQALYFMEIGLRLHDTMIYEKSVCPFPDINRYYQKFEYMFVLSKGKPKTFNPILDRQNKSVGRKVSGTDRNKDGTTSPKHCIGSTIKPYGVRFNIWNISTGYRQHGHPAVFPIQLANDHIISWSNKKDIVLDPFIGSGTTAIACMNTGRNFIGFEMDKGYYNITCKRIEKLKESGVF